jgi:hypothetical protein
MRIQSQKNNSGEARRRMIIETIEAALELAEKLGRHPLTKGCNCMACLHQRKRLLEITGKDWKFKL